MTKLLVVCFVVLLYPLTVLAQGGSATWKRRDEPRQAEPNPFHSTRSINLSTAETLNKGDFQFEISHRFLPPVSDGPDQFYGFDGPVNIRLGLAYAISDRLMTSLARSNQADNVDLQLKYKAIRLRALGVPVLIASLGGVAWNTDLPENMRNGNGNVQTYGQIIVNCLVGKKLALGAAPSYLYNAILESEEIERALTLGLYGQLYLTDRMSVLAEWNITEAGYHYQRDAAAFGIELETGGHFFKIVLTNSVSMNPSQYLIGTNNRFEPDEWRLGFNITRLLRFWK